MSNKRAIAVNQDPAAYPPRLVAKVNGHNGAHQIWVRPMQNGDVAAALINTGSVATDLTLERSITKAAEDSLMRRSEQDGAAAAHKAERLAREESANLTESLRAIAAMQAPACRGGRGGGGGAVPGTDDATQTSMTLISRWRRTSIYRPAG